MAQGKREEQRELILGQTWAIGAFLLRENDSPTAADAEAFVRTGQPCPERDRPQISVELKRAKEEIGRRRRSGEDVWATLSNPPPPDWEDN